MNAIKSYRKYLFALITIMIIFMSYSIYSGMTDLQSDYEELSDKNEKLKEENEYKSEKIDEYKKDLDKVESNYNKMKETSADLNDKVESLQGKNDELSSIINKLRDKKEREVATKSVSTDGSSKESTTNNSSNTENSDSRTLNMEATAYTAFCSTGCTGVTATGVDVSDSIYHQGKRVVAVDPSVIPLGSLVEVDTGSNSFQALAIDTGGDINGNRVDLLVGSKDNAYSFGRRNIEVTILD